MKHSVYMSASYIFIYLFNILPNKCILLHKICNVSVISSLLQMLPCLHATIICGTFTVIVNNISLGALVTGGSKMYATFLNEFCWYTCRTQCDILCDILSPTIARSVIEGNTICTVYVYTAPYKVCRL